MIFLTFSFPPTAGVRKLSTARHWREGLTRHVYVLEITSGKVTISHVVRLLKTVGTVEQWVKKDVGQGCVQWCSLIEKKDLMKKN